MAHRRGRSASGHQRRRAHMGETAVSGKRARIRALLERGTRRRAALLNATYPSGGAGVPPPTDPGAQPPSDAEAAQAVVVPDRPRIVGVAARFGITDPVIAAEIEEAAALLPRKRRLTLFGALEHGVMSRAVIEAGYHVKDVRAAADVARDIQADPLSSLVTRRPATRKVVALLDRHMLHHPLAAGRATA
jgi:hypothetical protein